MIIRNLLIFTVSATIIAMFVNKEEIPSSDFTPQTTFEGSLIREVKMLGTKEDRHCVVVLRGGAELGFERILQSNGKAIHRQYVDVEIDGLSKLTRDHAKDGWDKCRAAHREYSKEVEAYLLSLLSQE